ncbi:hypothetical protein F4680DRAFT_415413 [Xylaria scruposa]|nr:hypothetical protein F4680DRAFT_415413 [Xylaria scruposa]
MSRSLPPPPPPPAPPNPWHGRVHPGNNPVYVSSEDWPHRLLHVPTMTSHVRQGQDVYNGVSKPRYNILSYTWGFYIDRSALATPLLVRGVDWPIPPIKPVHFTATTFQHAIQFAAKGCLQKPCEWMWVDIACIPQDHPRETQEAKRLRGQEIGRQAAIFKKATEAFIWLSSMSKSSLGESQSKLTTLDEFLKCLNEDEVGLASPNDTLQHWGELDRLSQSFEKWMMRILDHPWFRSLWTVQEMFLRPNAFILFDDGTLHLYPTSQGPSPWTIIQIVNDLDHLRGLIWSEGGAFRAAKSRYEKSKSITSSQYSTEAESETMAFVAAIQNRMRALVALQTTRGLGFINSEFPHTAYSIAQNRRVSRHEDRIYGIVQTYGISCNPFPAGDNESERLGTLEDEFGATLVSTDPLLSQMFIHGDENASPRRSWLITQSCKVDDEFWPTFSLSYLVRTRLFRRFEVSTTTCGDGRQTLAVNFEVKAWNLRDFAGASLSPDLTSQQRKLLFQPCKPPSLHNYRGLMLDRHVSKNVLGHVVDYFDSHEELMEAIDRLEGYYGETMDGDKSAALKVALLGSSSPPNLPVINYIALVIAPFRHANTNGTRGQDKDGRPVESSTYQIMGAWQRIGLVRWTETYGSIDRVPNWLLPAYHELSGIII